MEFGPQRVLPHESGVIYYDGCAANFFSQILFKRDSLKHIPAGFGTLRLSPHWCCIESPNRLECENWKE